MFKNSKFIWFSWIWQIEYITFSVRCSNVRLFLTSFRIFSLRQCQITLLLNPWKHRLITHGLGMILFDLSFILWQRLLRFLFRPNFRMSHRQFFFNTIFLLFGLFEVIIIGHKSLFFVFFSILQILVGNNTFWKFLNCDRSFLVIISKWLESALRLFGYWFELIWV